jgi:hypothetical protein
MSSYSFVVTTITLDDVGACVAKSSGFEWSSIFQVLPSGKGKESWKRFEWKRPTPASSVENCGGRGGRAFADPFVVGSLGWLCGEPHEPHARRRTIPRRG